ncbi:MAG: lipoprotein-releasing ABC transporter permease subunit [Proteobacteria bacterium]|nr:lipoprotein-releasing ABC transporter permease subunit [Pseudomonadota bacterium]
MTTFATKVALRYLRSRRGFVSVVTGFSLAGILLGVAALIVVMAVMAGFRAELIDRILGTTGHANVNGPQMTLEKAVFTQEELLKVPYVVSATPYVVGQAMVVSQHKALGGIVRGYAPKDLRNTKIIAGNIKAGSLDDFKGDRAIVIGAEMANQLGVGVGSRLTVLSPEGNQTVAGFIPRMMRLTVVAIFDVGMYQYDSALMYMPIEVAQKFFRVAPYVSSIEVMVKEPDKIGELSTPVKNILGEDGVMQDWRQTNTQFFSALQLEKTTMFIILALIVLVAAFNIITGQMMTVNEKSRDIAILRTMGATRRDIVRVFFLSGFSVGFAGTMLGLVIGLLIVWNIQPLVDFIQHLTGAEVFSNQVYFLSRLPAKIEWPDTCLIVAMSLGLSILASLFPAWRAARLDPVEALRRE